MLARISRRARPHIAATSRASFKSLPSLPLSDNSTTSGLIRESSVAACCAEPASPTISNPKLVTSCDRAARTSISSSISSIRMDSCRRTAKHAAGVHPLKRYVGSQSSLAFNVVNGQANRSVSGVLRGLVSSSRRFRFIRSRTCCS